MKVNAEASYKLTIELTDYEARELLNMNKYFKDHCNEDLSDFNETLGDLIQEIEYSIKNRD